MTSPGSPWALLGGGPVWDKLDDERRHHRVARLVGQWDAGGLALQQGEAAPGTSAELPCFLPGNRQHPWGEIDARDPAIRPALQSGDR